MSDPKTVEFLPVGSLVFDPENPRLPERIKDSQTEQSVLQWMLSKGVVQELMIAIGEYGYFVGEPLLVVKELENQNSYRVIEGNRRLAAVKLLANPSLANLKSIAQVAEDARYKDIVEVPCVIFSTREEILRYLGYRHVTGVREWSALAKARYLAQLLPTTQEGSIDDKFKELARAIGSRSDYVARLLTGLALYNRIEENNFFGIHNLNEDTLSFSVLTTAASYTNIVGFLELEDARNPDLAGLDKEKLEKLTKWLFAKDNGKTRIGESRNLRMLNKVVNHTLALEQFESGSSLSESYHLAELPDDGNMTTQFRAAIMDAKVKLETASKFVGSANTLIEDDINELSEIQKLVTSLQIKVQTNLTNETAGQGVLPDA